MHLCITEDLYQDLALHHRATSGLGSRACSVSLHLLVLQQLYRATAPSGRAGAGQAVLTRS